MKAHNKPYPTPHIDAAPKDFAKTVLMPGDPLRAKFIAEHFLEDAKLVNNVRGVQGYTGKYRGRRVSVMASGMGMPSIAIYSYELFHFFDVENIIRIGSIGSIQENVNVRDLIFAIGSSTDSSYAKQFVGEGIYSATADFDLLCRAVGFAKELGVPYHVGSVLAEDSFYSGDPGVLERWRKMGILGFEMESYALYVNAAMAGKHALAMMTVSDQILRGEALSPAERQESFTQMMEVALKTAVS